MGKCDAQSRCAHLNSMERVKPEAQQETPAAAWATGAYRIEGTEFPSKCADVDGAEAKAERRQHAARHKASVIAIATEVADAEAVTPVMVMPTAAASTPASGGCGGS